MRTAILLGLLLVSLGACARGDKININCPELARYRHKVPMSGLEREIHGLKPERLTEAVGDSGGEDMDLPNRLDAALAPDESGPVPETPGGRPQRRQRAVLMLSGGGQWGAFGAGFLDQMRLNDALPDTRVVTGISTGSLQSLFVSIGTPEAYKALLEAYAPARESDVVDRGGFLRLLTKGSLAGLDPLRLRIEAALCPDTIVDDKNQPCAIDALRAMRLPGGRQSKYVLIGFTEAASGTFYYVDVVELAQLPRREARTCITGAALASAAMPVDFEQVQVDGVTYYDGGTRASVFEANVAASARRTMERQQEEEAPGAPGTPRRPDPALSPPIYVIRNGPTVALPDDKVNSSDSPITAAMRAEAILVNQLEVTSIAVIRIEHPTGPVSMVSADGYANVPCNRPTDGTMFSPGFMACLTQYGRTKANSPTPWIDLSPLKLKEDR